MTNKYLVTSTSEVSEEKRSSAKPSLKVNIISSKRIKDVSTPVDMTHKINLSLRPCGEVYN